MQKLKGGWKAKRDDSYSRGMCSDKNSDDNDNGDGDGDNHGNKFIQPKKPTKRLVKKSKWKAEK